MRHPFSSCRKADESVVALPTWGPLPDRWGCAADARQETAIFPLVKGLVHLLCRIWILVGHSHCSVKTHPGTPHDWLPPQTWQRPAAEGESLELYTGWCPAHSIITNCPKISLLQVRRILLQQYYPLVLHSNTFIFSNQVYCIQCFQYGLLYISDRAQTKRLFDHASMLCPSRPSLTPGYKAF